MNLVKLDKPFDLEDFAHYEHVSLTEHWSKSESELLPPKVAVVIDPQALHLAYQVFQAPEYNKNYQSGQFVEGLWEKDVAELFISDSNSSAYQEFNFAPSGAYWICDFIKYRQRSEVQSEYKKNNLIIQKQERENFWSILVSIPLDLIAFSVNSNKDFNLTVISNNRYYSLSPIDSKDPDFHSIFRSTLSSP